jgi:hypothetical protein
MTRPIISHDILLTDTTLRDGSHAMSHQFTVEQVRDTVSALDAAGVEVIEVAHGDGLGGSSFNYGFSRTNEIELIATARAAAGRARIAALLVPGIGTVKDLRRAHDAGADIVRIATHCTGRCFRLTLHRCPGARHGNGRVPHDGPPDFPAGAGRASPHHGRRRLPVRLRDRFGRRAVDARGQCTV